MNGGKIPFDLCSFLGEGDLGFGILLNSGNRTKAAKFEMLLPKEQMLK